jgi:predicted transcriptional regulator
MTKEIKINKEAWAVVESAYKQRLDIPQPDGSVSIEQFAKMRNITDSKSERLLRDLSNAGLARREKWGRKWVYWPNKK